MDCDPQQDHSMQKMQGTHLMRQPQRQPPAQRTSIAAPAHVDAATLTVRAPPGIKRVYTPARIVGECIDSSNNYRTRFICSGLTDCLYSVGRILLYTPLGLLTRPVTAHIFFITTSRVSHLVHAQQLQSLEGDAQDLEMKRGRVGCQPQSPKMFK
ncbi:hypothetical protein EVAR_62271_1 [Eumeta japonica]|uniref:Uncharacterized protein n=1 Tax=Eumeta variegata TaxID=151549 RepID=A0A4C1Z0I2_EUMVA|nr:hypothetical protein EVAR_62271_1 [Eumeta japonica]